MKWNGLAVLTMCVLQLEFVLCKTFKIRNTRHGKVQGYIQNIEGVGQVERYLGIPYAAAPIGHLRFEDPVDPVSWDENILSTSDLSPACPQAYSSWTYTQRHFPDFDRHSEDCLYLNMYVPVQKSDELMEVLFHIHGGSNEVGMGAMLHGDVLAIKANVVFISFNYRLGPLGFLGGNSSDFPGNYGIKDQVKALQWVQNNIHYFGGDKNKVTITGHSAGACDVGLHIISPMSQGLFRYAIMESGSPLAFWCTLTNQTFFTERIETFAKKKGCYYQNNMAEIKNCFKNLQFEEIIHHQFESYRWFSPFGINVGDDFLPKDPSELFEEGDLNGESFMTGVTPDEGTWGANSIFEEEEIDAEVERVMPFIPVSTNNDRDKQIILGLLKEEYTTGIDASNKTQIFIAISKIVGDVTFLAPGILVADKLASRHQDIYFYRFNHRSYNSTLPLRMGVPHGEDLFYLFGCPFTGHVNFKYNEEDKLVSDALIQMWSSFVKTGKPVIGPNTRIIPKYGFPEQNFIDITVKDGNVEFNLNKRMRPHKVNFWNHFMPLLDTVFNNSAKTLYLSTIYLFHIVISCVMCGLL